MSTYEYKLTSPDKSSTYITSTNQYWDTFKCDGTGRYVLTCAKPNSSSTSWLFLSSDGGVTWTRPSTFTSQLNWQDYHISFNGKYMFAITPTTCYVSDNYGVTWTTPLTNGVNMQAVCCNYEGKIIYIADKNTGLYVSTNFGTTFTSRSNVTSGGVNISVDLRYQGCTNDTGQYVYFCGGFTTNGKLIASSNYGVEFTRPLTGDITSVCCDITGQKVAAVNNVQGTLYISSNYGATFTQKLTYGALNMYSVCAKLDFSTIIVTNNTSGSRKLVFSTNMGTTWNDLPGGTTANLSSMGTIYSSSACETIYVPFYNTQSLSMPYFRKSSYDIPSATGEQIGALVRAEKFFDPAIVPEHSNYNTYITYFTNLKFRVTDLELFSYLSKPAGIYNTSPGINNTPTSYYTWCGPINYSINGTDLGKYVGPLNTKYLSGTSASTRSECLGIFVVIIGGGGGGGSGGVSGSSGGGSGGAGGGGGCIGSFYIENPNPGTAMSFTYAIGAGGAGGPIASGSSSTRQNGINGSNGGNTTFTYGGITYTAGGGQGGGYGFGSGTIGGGYYGLAAGGTGTNLTWSFNGNQGGIGSAAYSGSSKPGGTGGLNGNHIGNNLTNYAMINEPIVNVTIHGDGGDGGRGDSSASGDKGAAGAAGTQGAVIVFEHYIWKSDFVNDMPSITGTAGTDYSILFGSEQALVTIYSNQTVTLPPHWISKPISYILVGGGGSGSANGGELNLQNTFNQGGGGGTGGEVVTGTFTPSGSVFSVNIGAGGIGVNNTNNTNTGTDNVHNTVRVYGNPGNNSTISQNGTTVATARGGFRGNMETFTISTGTYSRGGPSIGYNSFGSGGYAGFFDNNGDWVNMAAGGDGQSVNIFGITYYFGGGGSSGNYFSVGNDIGGTGGGGGSGDGRNANRGQTFTFPDGKTTGPPSRNGLSNTGGGGAGANTNNDETGAPISGAGGSGICLMLIPIPTDSAIIGGTANFSFSNEQYKNDCIIITGSGTFDIEGHFNRVVDIWLVGGGGGGGFTSNLNAAGGGGGGGITILKNYKLVTKKTYTFTIGGGGAKGQFANTNGSNGGSTTFMDGSTTIASAPGGSGGSGTNNNQSGGTAGTRISNYPLSGNGGNGGDGISISGPPGKSSVGYSNGSGTNIRYYYFGGGGGGGNGNVTYTNRISGAGGLGGGGGGNSLANGGIPYVYPQNIIPPYSPTSSLDGIPNSGGGGAGGPGLNNSAGNGGSGVAVIWFSTGTSQDWSQVVT